VSDEPAPTVLSVDEVSISFAGQGGPERPVVDRVSFDLHAGRVLALVGESGSGKSVTAMSVLGLLPGTATVSGSIRLDGGELIGADAARLRQVRGGQIGTIFQEPMNAFNPVYTIGWQIAEAIRSHDPRTARAEVEARVAELLSAAGIRDVARVRRAHPHELSGGQLQRAMIAMAICSNPVALIADEPTTALDVTVQAGILDLIRRLRDEHGTAVLLITHDMGVVADLADDVVVMRDGRVVERADAATLFARPQAAYTKALLAAVPTLDTLEAPAGRVAPRPAEDAEPAAEVRGACIVYGASGWGRRSLTAVEDVSFHIEAGCTLGLVGESGSGKSTVGRALAGLVPLRAGAVRIGGVDLTTVSARGLRAVRKRIGYVFQDPASSLNPRLTIGQAIAEPLRLHTDASAAGRRTRVDELLDAVRLDRDFAGRFQHELSGGQRQRVAIARAIALNPTLLIADEPTSALDVSVQASILELIRRLQDELGFACLFISHDLAVVQALVDDVVVMRRGRIVEAGPAEQVLTAPRQPYTQRLLAAAPVADPVQQRLRRDEWRALNTADDDVEIVT